MDIVCVSQVLHHLPREVAVRWIAGVDRIARVAVVLADLHRTWPAMLGLWLVSFVMRLHPATRHDGVLSLRRGYTKAELTGMLREAGVNGLAYYAPIARIAAVWEPTVTSHAHR